ncbi:MAG: rRNA pseudouridine synthase [Anaerolineae bacterium]|nr:MAG: rRNA pseudouridine synthase [Anaerolineae bacterium]
MPVLLFNKPYGVLSRFTDAGGRPTLAEYIPVPGVYVAGRLDAKSEGLLVLTDDGALLHRLTHPRFAHPKTYWVQVEGKITPQAARQLERGITLRVASRRRGGRKIPQKLFARRARCIPPPDVPPRPVPVRDYHPTSWLEIILTQGKKHQVRRMTAAVGFPTLRLLRVAIGILNLEGLAPGQWRYLTSAEEQALRKMLTR